MLGVFNEDVEFIFICLEINLKVHNVRKNFRNLLIDYRDFLFDDVVRDSVGMNTSHKELES